MINAGIGAVSGDWSGVGAGIGGMVGSVLGWNAGVSGAALFSDAVPKLIVGAVEGAIEFGTAGFGAGFGGAIGGGASFRDAAQIGLITGGVSAIAGAIIEGTYMAGWQSALHGATVEDIARERNASDNIIIKQGKKEFPTGKRQTIRTPADKLGYHTENLAEGMAVEVRFWPRTETYNVTVLEEWATYNVFYESDLDTMGYREIISTKIYGSEYWVLKEEYTESVTSRMDYDPNPIIKRK